MVGAFVAGVAGVSVLARQHDVSVRVLDLAVDADLTELPTAVGAYKIRRSSGAIDREDALTPAETERALAAGAAIAAEEIAAGADLLIVGDMGIGNTTPAASLIAATFGLPAAEVTGRGTGIDDAALTGQDRADPARPGPRRRPGRRPGDPTDGARLGGHRGRGRLPGRRGPGRRTGAARRRRLPGRGCRGRGPGARAAWPGGRPVTVPPSRPSSSPPRSSAWCRCSIWDCGSVRAAVPSPRCRWSGRPPCCCRTWRCSPTSRELGVGLAVGGRHADGHPGPPAGVGGPYGRGSRDGPGAARGAAAGGGRGRAGLAGRPHRMATAAGRSGGGRRSRSRHPGPAPGRPGRHRGRSRLRSGPRAQPWRSCDGATWVRWGSIALLLVLGGQAAAASVLVSDVDGAALLVVLIAASRTALLIGCRSRGAGGPSRRPRLGGRRFGDPSRAGRQLGAHGSGRRERRGAGGRGAGGSGSWPPCSAPASRTGSSGSPSADSAASPVTCWGPSSSSRCWRCC